MKEMYIHYRFGEFNLCKKMVPFLIVIMLSVLISFSTLATAATHYVSKDGKATWEQSMNITSPCSHDTAVAKASAGDVVYYRAGTYTGKEFSYLSGGASGNPIIFQAYNSEEVIFDGRGAQNGQWVVDNTSYVTWDGFTLRNYSYESAIAGWGGFAKGLTFENMILKSHAIELGDFENLVIKDSIFSGTKQYGIILRGSSSNPGTQSRIENCIITGATEDAITLHEDESNNMLGDYHIIKDCTVTRTAGENCYDLVSGRYIVLKNSSCSGTTGQPAILLGSSSGSNYTEYVRIEGVTVNNAGASSEHIHLHGDDMRYVQILKSIFYGTGEHNIRNHSEYANDETETVRIFHNTLDGRDLNANAAEGHMIQMQSTVDDVKLRNNIFYMGSNNPSGFTSAESGGSDSDYNLFWHVKNSSGITLYGNEGSNTIKSDPNFINAEGADYALNENSPAINSGGWLTTITSATGSGKKFTVKDAYWFYDGWNIKGEKGDAIMTASGQSATVTSINYSTKQITVDRSFSWIKGEGIGLFYKGARPDIGAKEYVSGDLPSATKAPGAPNNLRVIQP